MVRYYIKEKPIFHDGKCMVQYEIWEDRGPFLNFMFGFCSCFVFGHFLDTNIMSYNKESAEKKLKEYVKFKQLGG